MRSLFHISRRLRQCANQSQVAGTLPSFASSFSAGLSPRSVSCDTTYPRRWCAHPVGDHLLRRDAFRVLLPLNAALLAGGRRFRSRTGIQLETTCADRPERLGLIPEQGGPQKLPPAGPARLPSDTSRSRRAVRSFASNEASNRSPPAQAPAARALEAAAELVPSA